MKINTKPKIEKITNHEGGESFNIRDNEEKLLHLTATCLFNEPKFYGEENETEQKIFELCKTVDPKFILQLATYLRSEQYLRTVSNALLVITANKPESKGLSLVRLYSPKIIQRADEINEVLAMQLQFYYKPIPNSLKKGLALSFQLFDEYQFSKYNRKGKVTFKDSIMLTHPKQPSDIIKKILDEKLKTPFTWETQLSQSTDKKKTWEELINSEKLGIFAIVRNLRNYLNANVSDIHINKIVETLKNEKIIKSSKLFPFRFYQAYKELESNPNPSTSAILDSLETAMQISFSQIPKMSGTTFIVCDTSGSMDGRTISKNSSITIKEIGLLLGVASHQFTDKSLFGCFGDSFDICQLRKTSSIIDNVKKTKEWSQKLGCSTNGFLSIQYLTDHKIPVDRIFVFTDCQLYDSTGGWGFFRTNTSEQTIRKEFNNYRNNINPNAKLYLFDLSTYGTVNFPESDRSVVNITGWSEKIFNFIQLYETDPKIQIKYIKEKY